jgi:DNA-directed RNA polymerase subunit M/transcription elongation factor TFIIS
MYRQTITEALQMIKQIAYAQDETGNQIHTDGIILLLEQACGKLERPLHEGGLRPIVLLMSPAQISKLQRLCVDGGETEQDYPAMAQVLLNVAISREPQRKMSLSDLRDGGDCPQCGAEESIVYHRDSGRDDEHYECEKCGETWYVGIL